MSWPLAASVALVFTVAYAAAWRKIEQIHILVNSRLSAALEEIRSLKKELGRSPDDT